MKTIDAIVQVIDSYGPTFAGNFPRDIAEDWDDHGFSPSQVGEWCAVGCWDAATAAILRDGGLTPEQAKAAAEQMAAAEEDAGQVYTDGCPIYAACNGDLDPDRIIEAANA